MSGTPVHTIRLHGPWEFTVLARSVLAADGQSEWQSVSPEVTGRVTPPCDWSESLGPDFRGRVQYLRRFGCPSRLSPTDRVICVIERVDAVGRVFLNGDELGCIAAGQRNWRHDLTPLLRTRNRLAIEVELPADADQRHDLQRGDRAGMPGGLIGEIRLEINDEG